MRRSAPALPSGGLPAAAPPALQGVLARGLGLGTGGRADRRAHRDGRGLPRRGRGGPDFGRARAVAEAVQAAVRGTTSLTCALGVASCKVVAKVASDRRKPGGLTVVPAGREAAFLAPFDVRRLPGVGPRSEQRLRRRWDLDRRRPCGAHGRRAPSTAARQGREAAARPGPRDRPAPARALQRDSLDQRGGDLPPGHRRRRAAPGGGAPDLRARRRAARGRGPDGTDGDDEGALPRLLDPLPSTSLPVATGDARRIAELACASSIARWPIGPARCGWSASAVSGWRPTGSSSSPPPVRALVLFGRPARDVPNRDDAECARPRPRNVAETAVEHDLGRPFGDAPGASVIGSGVIHSRRAPRSSGAPGDRAGEVALGQDPDQPSVVRDCSRQTSRSTIFCAASPIVSSGSTVRTSLVIRSARVLTQRRA